MARPRIAVLTTAHDQHAQLLHQIGGIALNTVTPGLHVVVAMADKTLGKGRLPIASDRWETIVRTARTDARKPLPVGAARNLGAEAALEAGSEVLVFLEAAHIPGERLLEAASDRALSGRGDSPVLWVGEVRRLPAPTGPGQPVHALERLASATTNPPLLSPDYEGPLPEDAYQGGGALVMTAADFRGTDGFPLGMADGAATDTAFARAVRAAGGSVMRFGGAPVYHQYSPDPHAPAEDAPARS